MHTHAIGVSMRHCCLLRSVFALHAAHRTAHAELLAVGRMRNAAGALGQFVQRILRDEIALIMIFK